MQLLNRLTCKLIGHEPLYFQARVMTHGQWRWQKHARCARCDSADSPEIHRPGALDLPAWAHFADDSLRSSSIEWLGRERRRFSRLFRKPTG
jgi:hypothetical protein